MRTGQIMVGIIVAATCATVAIADTCTNCKVRWMMVMVVVCISPNWDESQPWVGKGKKRWSVNVILSPGKNAA